MRVYLFRRIGSGIVHAYRMGYLDVEEFGEIMKLVGTARSIVVYAKDH